MIVAEAVKRIDGTFITGADTADREILGGYASDLLSDVIANSREGDIWLTMQRHVNIVAVAHLNGLAGIVLVNGRTPEPETVKRAETERMPLISTPLQAFEVAGILYGVGIRGRRAV